MLPAPLNWLLNRSFSNYMLHFQTEQNCFYSHVNLVSWNKNSTTYGYKKEQMNYNGLQDLVIFYEVTSF